MKEEIRVLLIEDDAVHARLVRGMLEHDENGLFTLDHASTLGEAMGSLTPGSKTNVILLDLGLPDASGLQTLQQIMLVAQKASVVVITGLQDEKLAITALREGAQDYIIKGQVDGGQLRRVLRYAVERQNLQSGLKAELEKSARVQEALQLSEQRYRLLSETAPMGILLSDELGRIIDANTQTLRMFGYERRELIGESVELMMPDRLRSSHQVHRSEYLKKPHTRPVGVGKEFIARRKDGTEFPVEIALVPLFTKEGVLISSTIVDTTERKHMEEQVRLSQRMEAIGKLAGGVAHDFNNLLAVILGSAELALETLPPDHPACRKVEVIAQAASSAADLTRQLLAFSRQQMLHPQVIDLRQIVERTEVLFRQLIGENIHIAILIEPTLGQIKADPGQIEQVLMNLAVNGRDAMPRGGNLTIEVRNVELDDSYKESHQPVIPGPYVMLSVADSGCGMNRETQARIFDPFFTTKEFGMGTGLGLATVYGIVKQSGGYIWVYSEPNEGTIFKVYLPRVDQPARAATQYEPEPAVPRGSETILLADDSNALRDMTKEFLESMGYAVLEAASGKEALQLAKEFDGTIHLLLTDVVMPEMSGPELAKLVAALRPEIKVIFTSGYADSVFFRPGGLDASVAFVQKPYRPRALARKIQEVLRGNTNSKREKPTLTHSQTPSML